MCGVDQGNAEDLNKAATYVLVFIDFSHFILLIKTS